MIVVVPVRGARVDRCPLTRGQVEADEPAAAFRAAAGVVDQRAAVLCPVRRLERLAGPMDPLPPAALDVQHFEDAADVVAIRNEALLCRLHDPHVAENSALGDVGIVRTEYETDEYVIAEIDVCDLGLGEGLAEFCGRHRVGAAAAFELQDVRAVDGRLSFFGGTRCRAPELQRCQAVAMNDGVDVWSVGILTSPRNQSDLAMCLDPGSQNLHASLQDEVAGHPLPYEVELVALAPHVGACGGDRIFL